ncbi:DUF1648 domain-containing protein [Bacillus sp. DX1.1]|uniref:DUF1648 domain-containing protein n=1 Tax=unclassified Bacillus (in: firmicutes) TaxID=185979 RepID=UPI002570FB7C|nr:MULTISPECIES: DUF1648 domain-containing protein [unclassified Bacillus (in: firmicutes)]MDM5153923.1 DUF1648 domain-containing protein [Bacillus sp. DX1.1]WJE82857.1 DUF1648 domain-containing protein [Bacillus sp. DX3.1]
MARYRFIMGIFLACLLITLVVYPYLPNYVAVHWNQSGKTNEFVRKQVFVLFIPCLIILLHSILYIISQYIYKFREADQYIVRGFEKSVFVFLLFIHMLVLTIGIGINIQFQTWLTMGISVFLFMISKGFQRETRKEEEPVVLQKIRLYSQRIFQGMAIMIWGCLFLKQEWGFYLLISVISCGSISFMFYILYAYTLENYET